MKHKLENNKVLFWGINLVVVLIFFWINSITPLSGDDLDYQKIFWTEQRVTSIRDIVESQIIHWRVWGGRNVLHFLNQFFLMYDKVYYNIANSIVFLLFTLLIYSYAFGKKVSNSFLAIEYVLLWITIPHPIDTIVWQTSSFVYLWASVFIMLFLVPYYQICQKETRKRDNRGTCLFKGMSMFFLGVLTGWTNEPSGAMLLLSIFLIIVYQVYKKSELYFWEIAGFVGALIGYAVSILAPGNFARADVVVNATEQRGLFSELLFRLARETYYMIIHMWPIFLILVVMYLVAKKKTMTTHIKFLYKKIIFFLFVSFVGIYVMTASPAYAERVLLTPIAFAMIAVGIMYNVVKGGTEDREGQKKSWPMMEKE